MREDSYDPRIVSMMTDKQSLDDTTTTVLQTKKDTSTLLDQSSKLLDQSNNASLLYDKS